MKIEIVEPQGDGVVLRKSGTKVMVWCDCSTVDQCPQDRIGSAGRCRVWIERDHLTDAKIEETKRLNRFGR